MNEFMGRRGLIPAERLSELTERSDFRGALQIASHFGVIALTGFGLHQTWGTLWAIPLFVLHGMLINYLFAAQHELNHYTAFRTRWVNDFFNRITGFVLLYPREYERLYHFEHHRHTQDWARDPELRRGQHRLAGYLVYLVGISYWIRRIKRLAIQAAGRLPEPWLTDRQRRAITIEARVHLAAYALLALGSLWLESWALVAYWLAPMLATKMLHQVQNTAEHTGLSHEPDTVHNTRTIKTWAVLRWMAWNMQYHTAHHTYPAVPFHRLPELHSEMVARLGYEPPSTGYLAFQLRFIRLLLKGPEPREGLSEVRMPPVRDAA